MTASDKGQSEPSMEEILASIRRIISDEKEDDGKDAPAEEPAAQENPASGGASQAEEEIVLTELVEESTEIDLSTPEVAQDQPPAITENVPPPKQNSPPAPAASTKANAPVPEPVKQQKAVAVASKLPSVVPEDFDVSETVAENQKLQDTYRGLVSKPVAEKSTLTFAALADAIHARGTPLGNTNMTLEDLIRDLLRPHLKSWLDENLPGLVEKLVRAEIERMSREAEERKDLV